MALMGYYGSDQQGLLRMRFGSKIEAKRIFDVAARKQELRAAGDSNALH